jgi:hypothetical protein
MKPNYVRFTDAVTVRPVEVPQNVKDYYATTSGDTRQPLLIKIAATHAGKVTRNNGFYLPHRMRAGAASFVAQYRKPIQVHHDSKRDPIGRVVNARYVDTSTVFRDSVADSLPAALDSRLQQFVAGHLSLKDTISFVSKVLIQDLKIVDDPDYEGLGYIEIVAEISDLDAIQKVIDGRYFTGSVGATTDQALCSICKQDWAEEGRCEHTPGKVYDGTKCVIIAGVLSYDEYSFVNKPADRHSGVIEINVNGIQDFVYTEESLLQDSLEVKLIPVKNNPKEDKSMLFKDALARITQHEFFKNIENLEDAVKAVLDNKELSEEVLDTELERQVATQLDKVEDFDKAFPPASSDEDETDPVKDFFADEYDSVVGDDEWGRDYAEMMYSLLDGIEDEAEREKISKEIKDAKLSAAQRKKLSKSSFCGPERSFPVNDCAHYTAALRLLNRYRGSGDKSKIRACVERKGKRMGCGSKNKDETQASEYVAPGAFDHLEDAELLDAVAGVLQAIEERGLEAPECVQPQDAARVEELEKQVKTLEEQAAVAEEEKIAVAKKRLDASHREIKYLHADIDHLSDAMADAQDNLRAARIQHICDLLALKGKEVDFTQVSDEHKEKSNQEISEILKDLRSQVDTKQIADNLNSGLSNKPSGKVDNPTQPPQDNTKPGSTKKEFDPRVRARVRQIWLAKLNTEGEAAAKKYLQDCVSDKLIPASMLKEE